MSTHHSKLHLLSCMTVLSTLCACATSTAQSVPPAAPIPATTTVMPAPAAPVVTTAPLQAASQNNISTTSTPSKLFADFGKTPKASNQGAELRPISYSEKRGDAIVNSLEVSGQAAVLKGQIGNTKGSQYSGVAILVSHNESAQPINLAEYKSIQIALASPTVTSLRLRISSNDSKIMNMGCYPIYIQSVTPEMKEYTISIARFESESFCGSNARTIATTIDKVSFIEVADTAHQRNKPTEFSLGKIEFVK